MTTRTRTRRFAPTLPDFTPPDDFLDLPPALEVDRDDEAEQTPVYEAARRQREQAGDDLPYQHPGELDLDSMSADAQRSPYYRDGLADLEGEAEWQHYAERFPDAAHVLACAVADGAHS
jgi:hypothetical protein